MGVIALVVLASTAVGILAHARTAHALRVARGALTVMLYALVPFVAFVNIAHLRITTGVGAGLGLAYLVIAIWGALAWLIGTRVLRLPRPAVGALVLVVILANTTYLGYPLTVALLGASQLPLAIAFDQLVMSPTFLTAGFGVGAAHGTRVGAGLRARLRAYLVRNPPLLAVAAGLVVPPSAAPHVLVTASHDLVWLLLALGFFAVGVHLAAERRAGISPLPPPDRTVAVVVALRMVAAPLLLLALSAATVHVPRAYVLEAAMPPGIAALIVGNAYGLDLRLISGALAWCTLLALAAGVVVALA